MNAASGLTIDSEETNLDVESTNMKETSTLAFARSNRQIEITYETSILDAADEIGIAIPYECRSGICGQCKTRLVKGDVEMDTEDALSPSEKSEGFILACQAHIRSHVLIDA
jgi:ferredoxin